jgi:transcriptional regulator of aromatic amino acid metabolism
MILISLITTFNTLRTKSLPKILHQQLVIVLISFICPYIVSESLQAIQFLIPALHSSLYSMVACSTILITYGMYFCVRTIMGLRFLNVESHVRSTYHDSFLKHFKALLEDLSHADSQEELSQLTHTFFKEAFAISHRKATLTIRGYGSVEHYTTNTAHNDPYTLQTTVESFINNPTTQLCHLLKQRRILMYDDIEFNTLYDTDITNQELLIFLNTINADIFLPIYDNHTIIAYVTIEKGARLTGLYGNIERDELLMVAHYLATIINLLRHRNLTALLHKEKELREELEHKRQELAQYKESLKSFLRTSSQKEIGIIFYKNRRFVFGNKTAKKLITVNRTTLDGHALTKAIKKVALQVATYKASQTTFATLNNNKKLVICGVPNIDHNNVIIMLYYPEISDILARNIALLKDPTEWDYLLYLETTRSGQLINQLIPGSGELLLNFKIDLLKTALNPKALLLEISQEDLMPTVEIIHHISLRETLHTINLTQETPRSHVAQLLFGINPLINSSGGSKKPLLSELDMRGTLVLNNIEHLDIETQQLLAEFFACGAYRLYKSEHKVTAHVRVICTTQRDLQVLIQDGIICKELFNELSKTSLTMPSLASLSEQEFNKLADGFTHATLTTNNLKNLLTLTDKEKKQLAHKCSVSLHDLQKRIEEIVLNKSTHHTVYQETHGTLERESLDPDLANAAHLGKKALRDPQLMTLLWKKFKNQNQIATLLGVNRSSINRRCKEYGLE